LLPHANHVPSYWLDGQLGQVVCVGVQIIGTLEFIYALH